MKKKVLGIGAICMSLAMTIALTGCGSGKKAEKLSNDNKKVVYTSFYPMYDFTKKIVGDKMEVVNLVPAGKEPHDYELTAEDRKNLEKATAIIYSGAGMEEWVDDLKEAMGKDKFIEASEGLEFLEGHGHHHHHHHHDEDCCKNHDEDCCKDHDDCCKEDEHHHDGKHEDEHDHDHDGKHEDHDHDHDGKHEDHDHDHDGKHEDHDHDHDHDGKHEDEHDHDHHLDPHVWLSPANAKVQLKNIKDAMIKLDKENKDYYEANFKKYSEEFDKLDKNYKEKLSAFKGKHIVVSHEAFGYICRDYGIKQLGIEGLSPDSEPSPKKMSEIVKFVKENKVSTIFFEELVSPKVAKAIAKETGAKATMLNPLEGLSQEDLKAKKDYISVMNDNLEALVEALK